MWEGMASLPVRPRPAWSLYATVCAINASMFAGAATILVVSPATVSGQVTTREVVVLVLGVVVVVLTNAWLVRGQLVVEVRGEQVGISTF